MNQIDELLAGSVDMHVHHGPDPLIARRCDALEAAVRAKEMGMGGLVLKSHSYPTAPLARTVATIVPNFAVLGSLCLEPETGGINASAVETSARLGAKVLWMPTTSAVNSRFLMARRLGLPLTGEGLSILSPQGQLLPQVTEVLQVVKDYDMVLATGHLAPEEIFALVAEAQRVGVSKIVITHPLERSVLEKVLSLGEQKGLAGAGAYIEHCMLSLMPTGGRLKVREMTQAIHEVGAEHCIMNSDFGQIHNPYPAEGMRLFIATMLQEGFSREQVELMVKTNPCRLLGLA